MTPELTSLPDDELLELRHHWRCVDGGDIAERKLEEIQAEIDRRRLDCRDIVLDVGELL